MKKIHRPILLSTFLLAAFPFTAQATSLVFGGVLEYEQNTVAYSIFGTGGSLPYTLTFSYDAPLATSGFVAAGEVTYEPVNGWKERAAQNMYGYAAASFTGITVTTAFGSITFDPNDPYNPGDPLDPYSYFYSINVGTKTGDFWFDTDITLVDPTKAAFNMNYNDPISIANPPASHYHNMSMERNFESVLVGEDFPPADPENAFLLQWKEVPLQFRGYEQVSDIEQIAYYSNGGTFAVVPESDGVILLGFTGAVGLVRRRRKS